MKNPWILPVATLLVGAVGGFISGKNTTPDTTANTTTENAGLKTRSSSRAELRGAESSARRNTRTSGFEQIGRLSGSSTRTQAMLDFYGSLTPEQLEQEASKLEDLPMSERIMASFLLFGRWAEVDPTSAMAFSTSMGFTGGFVRPAILQSWASVDPANAAKYYQDNPRQFAMMGMMGGGRGPMGGQSGASIIASEWAKQDPAGALAWANSLTTDKSQALGAVAGEVANADPKKAADMLASMTGSADLGSAYRSVATRYGAANFSEARAWINTLPADEQASALASAIGGLSKTDPIAAAAEASRIEDGETKDRLIPTIVGDLARSNPKAAADLLTKQSSDRAKREGVGELMQTWVNQDPRAALNFATSLEPGEIQDHALRSWVWSNSSASPAETIKVAEKISDENDRNRTVAFTAARWMREDEAAARAYVESSTVIPEDDKQNILEGRSMWGGRGRGRGGN